VKARLLKINFPSKRKLHTAIFKNYKNDLSYMMGRYGLLTWNFGYLDVHHVGPVELSSLD